MRWIGASLVALSLVFSTGGVAVLGHADEAQNRCEVPQGFKRSPNARPQKLGPAASNKSIVLNTAGYNYPLEGEWRPDPVAKPTGVPQGVLPDGHPSAPPASPAPK
jgi:hypothetical protein